MAVLVEALSVIIRRRAIDQRFPGGWSGFIRSIPNDTFCADDELARVGFMSPDDVGAYIEYLEANQLAYLHEGKASDLVVVDQMNGPVVTVDWLEFSRLSLGSNDRKVAACWLFEGPRFGAGIHMPSGKLALATPRGWVYEGSLSEKFVFVPSTENSERLKFLRHEDGADVYLDTSTGKEVFNARSKV